MLFLGLRHQEVEIAVMPSILPHATPVYDAGQSHPTAKGRKSLSLQRSRTVKASFTLSPAESKRLIAKAVIQMPQVKAALERAYVILAGGTTNAFIAQELLGKYVEPGRFTVGINMGGRVCTTRPEDRLPLPLIFHRGQLVQKTIQEALEDFHLETVVIKGANAVDPEGNVGVITSGFDGGTVARVIGTVTSTGINYIAPVGLEKLVPSVKEATLWTGAKTMDISLGANFGMYCLAKALVVTEIQALRILFDVEAHHVASGGIGGSEGSVVLVIVGEEQKVRAAVDLVESIKGEKLVAAVRANCDLCKYGCRYQGLKESERPAWIRLP